MTLVSKIKHTWKPNYNEEIDERDYMQIRNNCSLREVIKKLGVQATDGEKMFAIPAIWHRTQIQNTVCDIIL